MKTSPKRFAAPRGATPRLTVALTRRSPQCTLSFCALLLFVAAVTHLAAEGNSASPDAAALVPSEHSLVQEVTLDPARPCFVPTHPRVTTTLRFPSPIGAPEGRGFVEDEKRQVGEYVVAWARGDSHLTLSPMPAAGPLNLNVPHRGHTYVFYFYPVENQFQAIACLTLRDSDAPEAPSAKGMTGDAAPPLVQRLEGSPAARRLATVGVPQLIGLIDKLKLLGSSKKPHELLQQSAVMRLEACSPATPLLVARAQPIASYQRPEALWEERDCGLFSLRLLLIVADRRLDCVAFAVEVKNASERALAFKPSGFAARLGPRFLPALLAEGPDILSPGESRLGHFVIRIPADLPFDLANQWSISLELISPRCNPGATLGRAFLGDNSRRVVRHSVSIP